MVPEQVGAILHEREETLDKGSEVSRSEDGGVCGHYEW